MKHITIEQLSRLAETQDVEFKNSLNLRKEGMRALNAMVNADPARGTVLFGVAPDGAVVGVDPATVDRAQQTLAQHIREKFDPHLNVTIETLDCDGKTLVEVRATRPRSVPYHEYDGRAFIREGSTSRQLNLQEKATLTRQRDRAQHGGPWQCDSCGAWVGILTQLVMTSEGPRKTYQCSCGREFWPAS